MEHRGYIGQSVNHTILLGIGYIRPTVLAHSDRHWRNWVRIPVRPDVSCWQVTFTHSFPACYSYLHSPVPIRRARPKVYACTSDNLPDFKLISSTRKISELDENPVRAETNSILERNLTGTNTGRSGSNLAAIIYHMVMAGVQLWLVHIRVYFLLRSHYWPKCWQHHQ